MAIDVGKIIDKLKLSYGQLRSLLIFSIGAIVTVWVVGNKIGGITTQLETFNTTLTEIKKELVITRTETTNGLNKIYTDFETINNANNELWNSKFGLLLEHGDENKDLLKKLLEYEDKKNAVKIKEINTSKDYQITKKPPLDVEIIAIPVDEKGNPKK